MKALPASLRPRKRYLAVQVISKKTVSREDFLREIFAAFGSLFGDISSSECSIRLLTFENQKGILRCSHTSTEKTRAVLATITHIGSERVIVYVLGISGTVKGATQKYIQCDYISGAEQVLI